MVRSHQRQYKKVNLLAIPRIFRPYWRSFAPNVRALQDNESYCVVLNECMGPGPTDSENESMIRKPPTNWNQKYSNFVRTVGKCTKVRWFDCCVCFASKKQFAAAYLLCMCCVQLTVKTKNAIILVRCFHLVYTMRAYMFLHYGCGHWVICQLNYSSVSFDYLCGYMLIHMSRCVLAAVCIYK